MRGSKTFFKLLEPRIKSMLDSFTCPELCHLAFAYNDKRILNKDMARLIEDRVLITLRNTNEISVEDIALIVRVFCKTRTATRDFHKLLETTVLNRLDDIRKNKKLFYEIGRSFEESGLCSIDTIRILKKEYFHHEVEEDVFGV